MHFGASMFFTDYSMSSVDLARALEARGFESIWAPEHSHIPTSRLSPWGGGALHLDGAGQSALRLAASLCPPAKLAEVARRLGTAAAVIK